MLWSRSTSPGRRPTNPRLTCPLWRSPTSWAVTALFSVGAVQTFTLIQWLPPLLTGAAAVSAATAGTMLSMYTLIGLPHSLLVPIILARTRRPEWVTAFAALCAIGGPLGLAFAPHAAWIWIFPAALGAMFLPIGLTLVNLRTRTEEGATRLSGFVQGVGYLIAGAGPILVGYLHTATGGWRAPMVFVAGTGIVAVLAGLAAVRPVYVEDDVA